MNRGVKRGRHLGPIRRGRRSRLARALIAARLDRELSQASAAAEIGVTRDLWARWEIGQGPDREIYQKVLGLWLAGNWEG